MQKNLEQIRAANALSALEKSKELDKRDINKLPAMILANGLLAATAFANEGDSRNKGMRLAMDAVAEHLSQRGLTGMRSSKDMIADLASKDSAHLQRATTEALAYIGYLKRFATKGATSSNA